MAQAAPASNALSGLQWDGLHPWDVLSQVRGQHVSHGAVMKCGAVSSHGLEYGWEAEVHFYAKEHGIKITSKECYQEIRELIATLKHIEKLIAKQDDIVRALMVARKQRDEYKLKLGWKPIGGG